MLPLSNTPWKYRELDWDRSECDKCGVFYRGLWVFYGAPVVLTTHYAKP